MDDRDLVPGLASTVYVFDRRHGALAVDANLDRGPNIGARGVNLTIAVLSLDRAHLTARLLASIAERVPGFAGEVLIVDNGSRAAELEVLREAARAQPYRVRVVELGSNFGVAGGRNRAMPHVRSDWVMSLDNDVVFLSDPLAAIQEEIAVLGCHFLNLPLLDSDGRKLFARGGHLYLHYDRAAIHLGAGSACKQEEGDGEGAPFLSTFLFGGASVFNRHTFERLGGFDERMFIGFEDIDLSIRLFREGMKVGNSGRMALVHDHPPPSTNRDREYERGRFARAALERSARYLESKYGVSVWSDAVESWLAQRHRELGLVPAEAESRWSEARREARPADAPRAAHRPRVALVLDTEDWAFGNIARQLVLHLSDRFDFLVVPMDVIDDIDHVLFVARDCDVVHFFWREHLRLIGTPHHRARVETLCEDYDDFHRRFIAPRAISTSVYDHLLLGEQDARERRSLYRDLVAAYYVSSEKLAAIYRELPGYPPPAAVLEDGVDLGLFRPRGLERLESVGEREIVVGWAGNSKWAADLDDFKGLHTILEPALDELRAEGLRIRARFADRAERMIPHREMPAYYAGIDVYVCPSKIEGTPNPVLESMACGVPVISTDVGIVPQAFGPRQREFILEERSVACLKAALRRLVERPATFRELSRENLEAVQAWDWSRKAEGFASYFQSLSRGLMTRRACRG